MVELNQESQSSGGAQSPSLAYLCQIPIETRAAQVLEHGHGEISSTLAKLSALGVPIPPSLDAERLAWSVAFNVAGANPVPGDRSRPQRGTHSYATRWPGDKGWASVWSELIAPLSNSETENTSLLSELAMSVACEHRSEWQNPRARPVVVAEANRAFEYVYALNRAKVMGAIVHAFGDRAGNPEWISNEAWARVFCDYWSANSRRRFLGLCRISTLVCQVGRHIAVDALREQAPLVSSDSQDESTPRRESLLLQGLVDNTDPAEDIAKEQLMSQIKECMAHLSPAQKVVAEMAWFRQLKAKRVAEILGVSEPAVSQHLKKARERLRNCLKEHGLELPG
jgi:RNA polymerase sigma factor (sigma-70 family)